MATSEIPDGQSEEGNGKSESGEYGQDGKTFSRYYPELQHLFPIRFSKRRLGQSPVEGSGLLSYATFGWLSGVLWKIYRKGFSAEDVYSCGRKEECHRNQKRLEWLWKEEIKEVGVEKSSFYRTAFRFMRTRIVMSIFANIIPVLASLIIPMFFMYKLIQYADTENPSVIEGLKWVGLTLVSDIARVFLHSLCLSMNGATGLRVRSAALGLLYKKIMTVHTFGDKSIGQVINLFASDGFRIPEVAFYIQFSINAPLSLTISIIYVYMIFGVAALSGIAVILFLFPIMVLMSKQIGVNRQKCLVVTDHRMRLLTEILNNIKLLKLYAWEMPFSRNIYDARKKEERFVFIANLLNSWNQTMASAAPAVASVVSLVCHIVAGGKLTAAQAFSLVSVYSILTSSLYVSGMIMRLLAIGKVSFLRIQEVLHLKDFPQQDDVKQSIVKKRVTMKDEVLRISRATFSWEAKKDISDNDPASEGRKPFLDPNNTGPANETNCSTLTEIDLVVRKGNLVGICGAVGSGKSSLISAMLGQMYRYSGDVICHGSYAYASQQPWIINATLRENVLFGQQYDRTRYKNAIRCCGLEDDIRLLVAGDKTEIGEKGTNLSGGQKQRISLARAVYSDREIYLLDDPLSAVDAHVGKFIFNNCIVSALSSKTVIFVTHQMQYLSACDYVVLLKNGRTVEQGPHAELMKANCEYSSLILSYNAESVSVENPNTIQVAPLSGEIDEEIPIIGKVNSPARRNTNSSIVSNITSSEKSFEDGRGNLMVAEVQREGAINFRVFVAYIRAMGGFLVAMSVFLVYILNMSVNAFSNWWLSGWLNDGSGVLKHSEANETRDGFLNVTTHNITVDLTDITVNPKLNMYITVYSVSTGAIVAVAVLRGLLYSLATIKAAGNLHKKIFRRILQAPLSFFETTPSGRILHLFSADMDAVDGVLPPMLDDALSMFWLLVPCYFFVSLVFPWFMVLLVPLLILYLWISHIFRTSIRELKRAENASRSPLLTHLSTTVSGLATIRAYGKQKDFQKRFMELLDRNSDHFFFYYSAARWLFFRMEVLSMLTVVTTGLMVVFMRGSITAALAGLALSYASQVSIKLQYFMRCLTDLESQFTHVERLDEYTRSVPLENPSIIRSCRPQESWPQRGVVTFKNVHMRYREGLPYALQDVSFETKPREKIGIVGRTGSGKSSLGSVLFRTVEVTSGSIFIDGEDISKFGLGDLRSKMSLIPQDPALFVGTIRFNLDPFKSFTDTEIWDALEKSYMKDKVANLEGQLLAVVEDGGQNFSVGERQLLCVTRAILRKNKVLLLDEATAAVDGETDNLIQMAIRKAFRECTVLVIAHRLNTVLDSDRIIVMDEGKIKEMASPAELTSDPESLLSRLLRASGSKDTKDKNT